MRIIPFLFIVLVFFTNVTALKQISEKIVGGSNTTIEKWPFVTSLLFSWNLATYSQACGGTILTTTAILSAAHCFASAETIRWRARVGSTYADVGGVIHKIKSITLHEHFNWATLDSDVAVLRTVSRIVFSDFVQPGRIASRTYRVRDNEIVWAVGWGAMTFGESGSDHLQEVQLWRINQGICRNRYAQRGLVVTENMLCSGWLDVGGRDQCQGDSGGPLVHNDIVIGIASWGYKCGHPRYPGVNVRVSRFTSWIQSVGR